MSETNKIELKYENLTVGARLTSSGNTEITYRSSNGRGDPTYGFFKPESLRKLAAFLAKQADIAEDKRKTEKLHVGAATDTVPPVVGHKFRMRNGDYIVITNADSTEETQFTKSPYSDEFGSHTYDDKGRCGFDLKPSQYDLMVDLGPVKEETEPDDATAEAIADLTRRVKALEGQAEPKPVIMKVGEYYVTSMGITVKCTEDPGESTLGRYGCVGVKGAPLWLMDDRGGVCNPKRKPGNIVRVATPAECAEFELKREW